MLRKTSAALAVLALSVSLAGTAVAEDSYYPNKGDDGIDVSRYTLSLTWKPGDKTLVGTATVRLRPLANTTSFQLDLDGRMNVSSVTVAAVAAPFTHDGKDLVVTPATPLASGTTYDVVVKYAGRPRTVAAPTSRTDTTGLGWNTTSDGRVWTMEKPYGAYTWYPVNDHPSDKAKYTITLDVPDKWTGVANGRLVDKSHVGTRRITQFAEDHPMASYLVTVAIGPYKAYEQTGPHGLPITYWYPSGQSELLAPLKKTPTTIAWLEKKLGPYPFSRAGVVITPGRGSVESQTLITFAKDNYRYGGADVQEQIAHDLAHAWYGASVSPSDWRDEWLTEGPATYLQARYAAARGFDTWSYWKREFARNDDYYRELYGPPGAYLANEFGQRNVHYGGALILERLRAKIGTTAFYAALKAWPADNADRSRGRASFIDEVKSKTAVTGLDGWFDDWLTSPDTPTA